VDILRGTDVLSGMIGSVSLALRRCALLAGGLMLSAALAVAAPCEEVDHGGADLVVTSGGIGLGGVHRNIRKFEVALDNTVVVRQFRFESEPSCSGYLEIHAEEIILHGLIRAHGAGYSGGGGGGGGGGAYGAGFSCNSGGGGEGGDARYDFYTGTGKVAAQGGESGFMGPPPNGQFPGCCCHQGGLGGRGGDGDGPFAGQGSTLLLSDGTTSIGQSGGYLGFAANGDTSTDASTSMGSGGGGWAGGMGCSPNNPGTGLGASAGGSGGGTVRLFATRSMTIGASAKVLCDGGPAGGFGSSEGCLPDGGRGAQPSTSAAGPRVSLFSGSAGAGGGILLYAVGAEELVIEPGALIRTVGGHMETSNGGTVKIFHGDLPAPDPATGGFTLLAGRTLIAPRPIIQASMMVVE